MIFVYFIILILYLFIYAKAKKIFSKGNPQKHSFFAYIATYLYFKYPGRFLSGQIKEELRNIEPTEKPAETEKRFYIEKITLVVTLNFAGTVLAIMLSLSNLAGGYLENGTRIARNSYGEGSKTTTLIAELDKKHVEVPIEIEERKYNEEELEIQYPLYLAELEKALLGENKDSGYITKDLNFITGIAGYPFSNEWESSDTDLVDSTGSLGERTTPKEGELVKIEVTIQCGDWKREYTFYLNIFEKEMTWEEKTYQMLRKIIGQEQINSAADTYFYLPDHLEEQTILWKEKKENTGFSIYIFGLIVSIGMYFLKDREVHQKIKKRKEEMLLDYPEIISKLTLLMGAGMSLRQTIERIVTEYMQKKKEGEKRRYAYEEIMLTYFEMESGISEIKAYEDFGKRCRVQSYRKLGSLLAQNGKKGNSGLLRMLQKEAEEAFEERKKDARKRGEEAGTKLLLPMMIMLFIVMIVIIVPAFLSFQI